MGERGIEGRVRSVLDRIGAACVRAGREASEVTLIAVSKTFPESAIREAAAAGMHHFGENKAQEFAAKHESLAHELGPTVSWHFIGHLQRNKVKLVAGRADLIHGVDSVRLARTLQEHADGEDLLLNCLVQLNVSGEDSKFGLSPDDLSEFLREARALDRITWRGLMTLASPTSDINRLRAEFRSLRSARNKALNTIETMSCLSMGMTNDFEIAIEEGATHIRLGSALFGERT